jgi:hypothetical protein
MPCKGRLRRISDQANPLQSDPAGSAHPRRLSPTAALMASEATDRNGRRKRAEPRSRPNPSAMNCLGPDWSPIRCRSTQRTFRSLLMKYPFLRPTSLCAVTTALSRTRSVLFR